MTHMHITGDCTTVLAGMDNASIDLVMTSPPYANARKDGIAPDKYVDWFLPIADQIKRVLKPTGTFVLNIKEKAVHCERHTYVIDLILAMRQRRWLWTEEWIWHKKNCFPGKWRNRFRDSWERCLQFNVQTKFKMNQDAVKVRAADSTISRSKHLSETDKTRNESGSGSPLAKKQANWAGREWVYPSNVLHLATECSNRGHSAVFPEPLPQFFIKLFTDKGDMVCDPFEGSGTTGVVAVTLGRNYTGVELDEASSKKARERVGKADPGGQLRRRASSLIEPQPKQNSPALRRRAANYDASFWGPTETPTRRIQVRHEPSAAINPSKMKGVNTMDTSTAAAENQAPAGQPATTWSTGRDVGQEVAPAYPPEGTTPAAETPGATTPAAEIPEATTPAAASPVTATPKMTPQLIDVIFIGMCRSMNFFDECRQYLTSRCFPLVESHYRVLFDVMCQLRPRHNLFNHTLLYTECFNYINSNPSVCELGLTERLLRKDRYGLLFVAFTEPVEQIDLDQCRDYLRRFLSERVGDEPVANVHGGRGERFDPHRLPGIL